MLAMLMLIEYFLQCVEHQLCEFKYIYADKVERSFELFIPSVLTEAEAV